MSNLPLGIRIQKAWAEIELQERVIGLIAASLDAPTFREAGHGHPCFRFTDPGWRHFCLLKSVRAVSGLNACCRLCGAGFTQEMIVLIRAIAECTTQIEFILAGLNGDNLESSQSNFVQAYFADSERDGSGKSTKIRSRQGDVHKIVGRHTDEMVRRLDLQGEFTGIDSADLLSRVYLTNSNYVHSRYPEVMDMFGGAEQRFHLRGMRGTPKDIENIETLEAFVVTVSNALKFVVLHMGLTSKIQHDAELAAWYPLEAA